MRCRVQHAAVRRTSSGDRDGAVDADASFPEES
jgi:hypothetical protein